MYQIIQNLIKNCKVNSSDDSKAYAIVNVEHDETSITALNITPYGYYSRPPADATGILLLIGADASKCAAIVNVDDNRYKNLEENEVALGNPSKSSKIFFDKDGKISIESLQEVNVTAPSIVLGNGGSTDGLVKHSELKQYIDNHIHQIGMSTTEKPTTQLPDSAQTTIVRGG